MAELSHNIFSNPETGFQEKKAVELLSSYLKKSGYAIESGICELPTAFRAKYGRGKPVIALLAEYDALPGMGHACGHNIIAASAAGAAASLTAVADRFGGTIVVLGTPAEELQGGKIILAERGAFSGIDAAMMIHPGNCNAVITRALDVITLYIEFFGRASHAAAAPELGINALDAMVLAFNAINSLRQHIKTTDRIHGIIVEGGHAANIVPDHTKGEFLIRGESSGDVDALKERVLNCFIGAAKATGARLQYKWGDTRYAAMRNNLTMANFFKENLEELGRTVFDRPFPMGSTDMGNVSQILPAIHPFINIGAGSPPHTEDFAAAANSDSGVSAAIIGAKAMAMTIADLLIQPDYLTEIKKEFNRNND